MATLRTEWAFNLMRVSSMGLQHGSRTTGERISASDCMAALSSINSQKYLLALQVCAQSYDQCDEALLLKLVKDHLAETYDWAKTKKMQTAEFKVKLNRLILIAFRQLQLSEPLKSVDAAWELCIPNDNYRKTWRGPFRDVYTLVHEWANEGDIQYSTALSCLRKAS